MAQRVQLVCQHLERIKAEALREYEHVFREYIRGRHGVYALYKDDRLYYVGLARNLRARLRQHLNGRKHRGRWNRFSIYFTLSDGHLKELESLLLRIGKPRGNRQSGKFVRSENLNRRFARDLRRHHNERLQEMIGNLTTGGKLRKRSASPRKDSLRRGLGPLVDRATPLRARHKGQLHRATLLRDGQIRFNGRLFRSPSRAAAAAVNRRSCNGLTFWKYMRSPGEWASLSQMKR